MTNRKLTGLLSAASLSLALSLTGCGAAETASVAAAEAELAKEQLEEGKKLQEKVEKEVAAAQQATADAIKAAESASSE
jgi:hypothetical protein